MSRILPKRAMFALLLLGGVAFSRAAGWQYYVPVERGSGSAGKAQAPGKLLCWMPPKSQTLAGLLIMGQLGIEAELAVSPEIRRVCAQNDIGIAYFEPHISGVFHYWEAGNTDGQRWLKALDELAGRTGHPEVRRVPWIPVGHSTAGIFCRNVAYWQPSRVAGVVHIKSGNFWQKEHLPPSASLKGVPLIALNGQFETFGPAEGIQPDLGRETQWRYVLRNLQQFRQADAEHLMSLWIHQGDDHFHGAPELEEYVALFVRKCAQYRLPKTLPPGDAPVNCLPLQASQGWLTDPDLYAQKYVPAPYQNYAGDKTSALWHFDREIAEANTAWHKSLAHHQCLDTPTATLMDDGDGWSFTVTSQWLDRLPEKYGGKLGNQKIGHSATPFVFRSKANEPVAQIGSNAFRVLRLPTGRRSAINIAAFHPGDAQFRSTVRWGTLAIPAVKGQAQTIEFPAIGELRVSEPPRALNATSSSGLPVHFEVDYGPVAVKNGAVFVAELCTNPQFPIECKITAYQMGRCTAPPIAPAAPVPQVFQLVPH